MKHTAGFFDVDSTLCSTNIVSAYLDFRLQHVPVFERWVHLAITLVKSPYYALLDNINRDRFCEVFYRKYAQVAEADLERWAAGSAERYWSPRLFPSAIQQLEEHRALGHRIILISGGIEPMVKPLAEVLRVDAIVGAKPEVEGRQLTGRLVNGALNGIKKAEAARHISALLGVDLKSSYAYGDSYADTELLECVGNPVAVNPDRRLRKLARSRGWPIHKWSHTQGG